MNQTTAQLGSQASALDVLTPLLKRYGVTCSLEEFHEAVNVVFHDMESSAYDRGHVDMWKSLPRQFQLLADDVLSANPASELRLLDIGCGTGLSSMLLLESSLGARIKSVHLLDTSAKMLEKSAARIAAFPGQIETTHGTCSALTETAPFDLILTSSVLHHIPDLKEFCAQVSRLQAQNGFFIHLQDPNADSQQSESRRAREAEWKQRSSPLLPRGVRRLLPQRVIPAIWRRLTGKQKQTYITRTNDELIARGIIERPLTEADLWSVTDIHIESGCGISVDSLRSLLSDYQLLSPRSYGFFSVLESSLPKDLASRERELVANQSMDGFYLAAVWQKQNLDA